VSTIQSPKEISERLNVLIHPESFIIQEKAIYVLAQSQSQTELLILAPVDHLSLNLFEGKTDKWSEDVVLKRCPTNEKNAGALRQVIQGLEPTCLGLHPSVGFGDRLGLATPGHVLALRRTDSNSHLAPIFAQQSRREMIRSGRSPLQVLTDATWGAFQGGWKGPVGADADHLKTTEDIDLCASAGFTFFTLDPGSYVDSCADSDSQTILQEKVQKLPFDVLESSPKDLFSRYQGRKIDIEGLAIDLNEQVISKAAVKYGRAIAHIVHLSRHLEAGAYPFELEISVDETETPTTHAEHVFIASELKRLGVKWVSLAPRFVGSFEKGVDYVGDLQNFAVDVKGHAAIARAMGPYKISLHSGSDKFSIYPFVQEATQGLVHLKTAGTSYLEALRVLAQLEPVLFREILSLAVEHYQEDRASYHVSADLSNLVDFDKLADNQLPDLLEDRAVRQVLHVTFGSVATTYKAQLSNALIIHAEFYKEVLSRHFSRHISPFLTPSY
jgi:tagaturonate epimerase